MMKKKEKKKKKTNKCKRTFATHDLFDSSTHTLVLSNTPVKIRNFELFKQKGTLMVRYDFMEFYHRPCWIRQIIKNEKTKNIKTICLSL